MGTTKVRILAPTVSRSLGIEGDEGIVGMDSEMVEEAIALGAVERVGRQPSSDEESKAPAKAPAKKAAAKK